MANARKSSDTDIRLPAGHNPVPRAVPTPQAFPREADMGDLSDGISPARAQQAWLETALQADEPEKFSYGARMALIGGVSCALWLGIAALFAAVLT